MLRYPGREYAAALILLVISEVLLVHWGRLALVQPPLETGGWLVLIASVFGVNAWLMAWVGSRTRWGTPTRRLLLGISMAALGGGTGLLAVFALSVVLRLVGAPISVVRLVELGGGGAAVAIGSGSVLWGYLVGQRRLVVEECDLPMSDLPATLAGMRVVQITDLHIGPQLRASRLRRFVDRVNRLEPDLIAITGDIFDFDPAYIEEGCTELGRLHARHGVYAVLGNHDVYTGADAVCEGLETIAGLRVLRDSWECLSVDGAELYVLGIEDPGWSPRLQNLESPALERLAQAVPQNTARLLLMHRPNYFDQVAELGLPAALAGHTHGGQITLPPPAHHHNVSRITTPFTRGFFQNGNSVLYVSRGMGVGGIPVRLNCPREISLLTLTAAPAH